ncbi:unnamed protein product [Sphagnum troendelagicum]|uniref:DNA-directed RNA polymerase n=1 Tax=Sphagnum troendelagicum TaxID=128251 RepID=A0ABP0UKT9_9BRYO
MEEDPKVGHQPLRELAGLQFGRLSNEDTVSCNLQQRLLFFWFSKLVCFLFFSVCFFLSFVDVFVGVIKLFENNQNTIGPKTPWDSRFGVYFLTGDGSRRSSCGAFTKTGQLGHIVLPMPVYHPFHVAFTQQILCKIYMICYKLTLKKKVHSYSFQLLFTT